MRIQTSRHLTAVILSLLASCIAACGLFVKTLPSGQVLDPSPSDRFVEVQGIRIHYEEYPGKGPPVVLLHGFGSSTYTWREVIPLLQEAGLHVYALDMKGYGWSEKPLPSDYSPEAMSRSVLAWMDALGIKACFLAGNSLGGAIGLLIALEEPTRLHGLILLDAAGYPREMPYLVRIFANPVIHFLAKPFFGRYAVKLVLHQVYYDKTKVTEERITAYYDRLRTQNALNVMGETAAHLTIEAARAVSPRFKEIRIPVLVLWGEKDPWIPVEHAHRFHEDIRQSSLVVLPNCGHVPQEEFPMETARAMKDFILSLESGSR